MGISVIAAGGLLLLNSAAGVVIDAVVDVGADMVLDGVNSVIESSFPATFDNKYYKQFMNSMRMGATCATNAYVSQKAMGVQRGLERKTKFKLESLKHKHSLHQQQIASKHWIKTKGKNKAKQKTKEEYHKGIADVMKNADRQVKMRHAGATEGTGFAQGTGGGGYKGGLDGTIQNTRPDGTIALSKSINALLNGMDKFPDKSGTPSI